MDPLSLSAATITFLAPLVAIARVCLSGATRISGTKSRGVELANELQYVVGFLDRLQMLQGQVEQSDIRRTLAHGADVLIKCQDDLSHVHNSIEKLQSEVEGPWAKRLKAKILLFFKLGTDIDFEINRVQRVKSTLIIAFDSFNR